MSRESGSRRRYAKGRIRLLFLTGLACLVSGHATRAQTSSSVDATPSHRPENPSLRGGWYPWDPYQYRDYRHGVPILTGWLAGRISKSIMVGNFLLAPAGRRCH